MPAILIELELIGLLTVLGMAIVTFLTRAGGFWLMRTVTMTPLIEAFLRGMAGSVVIAIIVPAAAKGDWAARAAIAASLAVMLATRQPIVAMLVGVAVAAAWRAAG